MENKNLVLEIKKNLSAVKMRIARASENVGRDPSKIKIVAVSKLMPPDVIVAGVKAGIRCFGENYPERAAEKIKLLDIDENLEWHMIGHIQSRKAETVCEYFDMVHSIDRMKIARYLDRYAKEHEQAIPVLLEVNLSGEKSKYGWNASEEGNWRNLIPEFEEVLSLRNLQVKGLMTMPPLYDNPEQTRPIYKKLGRLQKFLRNQLSESAWDELSIGTSFDYLVAVEEGATMVRIGTEIFGPRSKD